jgi:hypothetical protein
MKKYAFDDVEEALEESFFGHDHSPWETGGYDDASEDVSAIGDPMPIASMLWQLGQNVKDPVMNALRKQFEHEVDGRDWTHMTQDQRRKALSDGGISGDYGKGVPNEAIRNYADLTPVTKWKLKNIEAEEYQGLSG